MLTPFRSDPRQKLAALWAGLMFLYAYADILSFYRPGHLEAIAAGHMGPLDISQGSLAAAAALMALPALMIYLSLALPAQLARWGNLGLGALYTLVNISNLIGESWTYYLGFGALEIVLTLTILVTAWRWPRARARA